MSSVLTDLYFKKKREYFLPMNLKINAEQNLKRVNFFGIKREGSETLARLELPD